MPSPSLTEGSLYGILDYLRWDPPIKSGMTQGLEILEFLVFFGGYGVFLHRNSRFLFILGILEFLAIVY